MRLHYVRLAPFLALACAALLSAAASADPTYTVSGVHVDATAASASAAQAIAIDQGRPIAWGALYRRLARQADWSKQPRLDIQALRSIARGYTVSKERRSTTRYVADVTYIFSPEAVARILHTLPGTSGAPLARRILVVPMSPTFVGGSEWANAFLSARFGGSQVPFTIPSGGSADVMALGRLQFDATNWADVELVAARIHATEAVLVLAIPIPGKIQLWLKRIGAAETPTKTTFDVPLNQSVPQTYPNAADAAVHAIEDMWRQRGAIEFTSKGSLIADVHISSLQQWNTIQSAMSQIANVRDVAVVAMDIGLVRISVTYLGTVEQLHDALLPVGVTLTKDDAGWSIAYAPPLKPSTASETP